MAFASVGWLLDHQIILDDSFYYFVVARNATSNAGFSFDRLTDTNGFHPLWMLLNLPFFALIKDPYLVINAILLFSAILAVSSVYLLLLVLDSLRINRQICYFICFFYGLSPVFYLSSAGTMNGLETPVNVNAIFLFLLVYLKIIREKKITRGYGLLLGLFSGLLFLARTDNALLLVFTWAGLFIYCTSKVSVLKNLSLAGITAFMVILPWLIWTLVKFGSLIQISGLSVAYMTRDTYSRAGWGFIQYSIQYLSNLAIGLARLTGVNVRPELSLSLILLILLVSGAVAWVGRVFLRDKSSTAKTELLYRLNLLVIPLGFCLIFVLVHTIRAVRLKSWYYSSILPILFVVLAIILNYYWETRTYYWKNRQKEVRFLLVLYSITIISFLSWVPFAASNPKIFDSATYNLAPTLKQNLPEGSRIGAFNAGILSYFSSGVQIVNLDGLVNNAVYPYLTTRSLSTYIKEQGIDYIVDFRSFLKYYSPFWDSAGNQIENKLKIIKVDYTYPGEELLLGQLTVLSEGSTAWQAR